MEFNELYKTVIKLYQENKSVKQTADALNVSVVKVRRILITESLWHSETSDAIFKLYKEGLSTDDIAFTLGIGRKNVQAYIPYTRGLYGESESSDSVRSNLYRERMHDALESQISVNTGVGKMSNIIDAREYFEKKRLEIPKENPRLEIGRSIPFPPQGDYTYELKLELVNRSYGEADYDSLDTLADEDYTALKRLAKAEKGISRTVLVPSDITLHSLHYLIQKAFGFLNGHLHSYSLLNSDFNAITDNNYGTWLTYQGAIFRTPDEQSDRFWDDDYDGHKSINTWLKSKYQAPYRDRCASDTYLFQKIQHEKFESFISNELKIKPSMLKVMSLEGILDQFYLPDGFNNLLERLSIGEILKPARAAASNLSKQIKESILHAEEKISEIGPEDQRILKKYLNMLTEEYNSMYAVKSGQYNPLDLEDSPEEYINECIYFINELSGEIWPDAEITNPKIEPFTNRILYTYDYGDDWNILITCVNRTPGKIDAPVCIKSDGLNLIDNAGGIYGYIETLKQIAGEDGNDTAEETKEWARGLGFTGRKNSPKNIL